MSSQSTTPTSLSITNGLELEKAPLVIVESIDINNHVQQQPKQQQQQKQHNVRLSSTCSTVVIGILLTEAMQSFAFYGSQIILVLYLTQSLGYSEASSIALFSFLSSFADLTPIVGAVLADGWWGRKKTILYFGTVAAIGLVITTLGASHLSWTIGSAEQQQQGIETTTTFDVMFWRKCLSFTGLILLFVGIGCIDPCLSSFGADQVVGTLSSSSASVTSSTQQQEESPVDSPSSTSNDVVDLEQGNHNNDDNNNTTTKKPETEQLQQQQQQQQQVRVRAYFAYLYFCTNVGAVASCGLVPLVREYEGFGMAFFVCAICISIGLACFMSQRNKFNTSNNNNKDSSSSTLASTFALCAMIICQRIRQTVRNWTCRSELAQPIWNDAASSTSKTTKPSVVIKKACPDSTKTSKGSYGSCNGKSDALITGEAKGDADEQSVRDAKQALRVVPIMAMLPVFWMLYDQQESVWILQASRMSLHGLQPEQLSLVNPIQIMMFIPLFDRYVYPTLTRYGGGYIKLDPLSRMSIGMGLAACAFVMSGIVEIVIQRAEAHGYEPPSVLWQLIQITLMAVSEILVSVTGLEFSYSAAPPRLKAFLMAIYSFTKAFGDLLGGLLYSTLFQHWDRSTVMYVCALVMILNRFIFDHVAHDWYKTSSSSLTTTTNKMETKNLTTDKKKKKTTTTTKQQKTMAQTTTEKSSLLPH